MASLRTPFLRIIVISLAIASPSHAQAPDNTTVIHSSGPQDSDTIAAPSKERSDSPDTGQTETQTNDAQLHPAFRYSADQVQSAEAHGQSVSHAGKGEKDLIKGSVRTPRWTRGNKGEAKQNSVFCPFMDPTWISLQAYRDASLYQHSAALSSIHDGTYLQRLFFIVDLRSIPKVGRSGWWRIDQQKSQLRTAADQGDVHVVKFVLSDDQGHFWEADPAGNTASLTQGMKHFSGVSRHLDTTTTQADVSSDVHLNGPAGSADGTVSSQGTFTTQTMQITPWSADHPYYEGHYAAAFSLFDLDGQARIRPAVKTLTLHIIVDNGEQAVEYSLPGSRR